MIRERTLLKQKAGRSLPMRHSRMSVSTLVLRAVFCIVAIPFAFAFVGGRADAMNFDHPGSCLYVKNMTNAQVTITLVHPSGYNGYWTYAAGEMALLSHQGSAVKSADGGWSVNWQNYNGQGAWAYDPSITQDGCAGEWILTMAYPAPADEMNYDHPGACLYVKNTTSASVTIRVTHPTGYENVHWTYAPGEFALLSSGGVAIQSPDGGWDLSWSNYSGKGSWSYDSSITEDGCAGEWVFTM